MDFPSLETVIRLILAAVATPFALRTAYLAWPFRALPGESGFDQLGRAYFNPGNALAATGFLWASLFTSGGLAAEPFLLTIAAFAWVTICFSLSMEIHRRAAQRAESTATSRPTDAS